MIAIYSENYTTKCKKKTILKCELACAEMKEKNWMDKKIKKMKIIEENKLSADEKKLHRL